MADANQPSVQTTVSETVSEPVTEEKKEQKGQGLPRLSLQEAQVLMDRGIIRPDTFEKIKIREQVVPDAPAVQAPVIPEDKVEASVTPTETQQVVNNDIAEEGSLAVDVIDQDPTLSPEEKIEATNEIADEISGKFDRAAQSFEEAGIEEQKALSEIEKEQIKLANKQKVQAQVDKLNSEKRSMFIQEKLSDLDNKLVELEKERINPNKFFENKSVPNKILSYIAIGLSGAAAGAGNQNTVLNSINRQIQQDIESQKSNLANRKATITDQQKIVSQMMDTFQDERIAGAAANAAMLQGVQTQIAAIKNKSQNAKLRANADQLLANLEVKKQEALQKFRTQAAFAEEEISGKISVKDLSRVVKDPEKLAEIRARAIVNPSTKKVHFGLDKESVRKFREKTADAQKAINTLGRIKQLSKQNLAKLNPVTRAKIAAELNLAIGQLRIPLTGPGILTETEIQRMLDTLGNPNDLTDFLGLNEARLATSINSLHDSVEQDAEINGLSGFSLRPGKKLKTLKRK